MKLPDVANLLTEKMFNVFFFDKPALKVGQQFTGTAAETTPPPFFRLNAVNAAIFAVKLR